MDRFLLQEVDVHKGLESRLTILGCKIRVGIESGKKADIMITRDLIVFALHS